MAIYETRFGADPFALCIACAAPYTGRPSRDGWGQCPAHAGRMVREHATDPQREAGKAYGKVRTTELHQQMRHHLERAIAGKVGDHRIAEDAAKYPHVASEDRALYFRMDTFRRLDEYVTLA